MNSLPSGMAEENRFHSMDKRKRIVMTTCGRLGTRMLNPRLVKLKDVGLIVVYFSLVLASTLAVPSLVFSAPAVPNELKKVLREEITVNASESQRAMPEVFKCGVFEVNEQFLTAGERNYLAHKFFTEQLSGMTTIPLPLHANSFNEFKHKVEVEGLLQPAVAEARKVLRGGGTVLFDISTMPKWLSSNLARGEFFRFPPRDYNQWRKFVAYIVSYFCRNGIKEAGYRIWEEVDAGITKDLRFWNGTKNQFYKLYDYSVKGILSVDDDAKITFGNSYLYSDIMRGMINFVAKKNLPLDYVIYHPFLTLPYPSVYHADVRNVKDWLAKARLDESTPIHAESWNSWHHIGKPNLSNGQPDERSAERDTEYDAAYAVQTLFAQDAGGITYQSFFCRRDPLFGRYYDAGLIDKDRQFYGDWGMLTRDFVAKPVYNAFRALSILSGKEEDTSSDRLPVTFDQDGFFVALASETKDQRKVRILLSHKVDVPSDRIDYFRHTRRVKYWDHYVKMRYGDGVEKYKICIKGGNPSGKCRDLVPQALQPYVDCVNGGRGKTCQSLLPKVLKDFSKNMEKYLQNYMQYPKEVRLNLRGLPFQGRALLTLYRINRDQSNSCRYNKRTERKPTPTECGIQGEVDISVRKARQSAEEIAAKTVRKYSSLKPARQKIMEGLFYNGTYQLPGGQTIKSNFSIDQINRDPHVSLEGSKTTKEITIGKNGTYVELLALQPYEVVLAEISKF